MFEVERRVTTTETSKVMISNPLFLSMIQSFSKMENCEVRGQDILLEIGGKVNMVRY